MPSIEEAFEKAVQDEIFPGAVLLAKDKSGQFSYSKAVGKQSLGSDRPMQTNAVFMLASVSKLMTSIASMQIVERGLIQLDDDVSSIVPELAKQDILTGFDEDGSPILKPRKKAITLRHLLSHSAGVGYDFLNPTIAKYVEWKGNQEIATVEGRFSFPLLYEPGEGWEYGAGIDWAGKIVERLSGDNLEDYMQKNIWEPLGITGITFWPFDKPDIAKRLAGIASRDPETQGLVESDPVHFLNVGSKDSFGGHGGYADLDDYLKILHSLLIDDERLIKKETAAQMFQPQLNQAGSAMLKASVNVPSAIEKFPGDFPVDIEYNWGIGGLLVQEDEENRRKKGTLIWSGATNVFWFINRETGITGIFGTSIIPCADAKVQQMIKLYEDTMYQKLAESRAH